MGKLAIRDNLVKLKPLRWSLEAVDVHCFEFLYIFLTLKTDKMFVKFSPWDLSLKWRWLGVGFAGLLV